MLIYLNRVDKVSQRSSSISLELRKSMINDCLPLLRDIVSNIRHEKEIVDTELVRKLILDNSDFLS